jgi:hypothetical protein
MDSFARNKFDGLRTDERFPDFLRRVGLKLSKTESELLLSPAHKDLPEPARDHLSLASL